MSGDKERAISFSDGGHPLPGEGWKGGMPDQTPRQRIRQFPSDMAAIVKDYHERMPKIGGDAADEYLERKLREYAKQRKTPQPIGELALTYADNIAKALDGFNEIIEGKLVLENGNNLNFVAGLPGTLGNIQLHLKSFSEEPNNHRALAMVAQAIKDSGIDGPCRDVFDPARTIVLAPKNGASR